MGGLVQGVAGVAVGAWYTTTPLPPHPGRSWTMTSLLYSVTLTLRANGCDDMVATVPGSRPKTATASIRQVAKLPRVKGKRGEMKRA